MKRNFILLLGLLCALTLTSCYGTKTSVGAYRENIKVDDIATYNYSKGKQMYLFWGFLPMGRAQVATPHHGNCQIKTRHGLLDMLLTFVTGGLFSMQTIKVKAPKVSELNPYKQGQPQPQTAYPQQYYQQQPQAQPLNQPQYQQPQYPQQQYQQPQQYQQQYQQQQYQQQPPQYQQR